MAASENGHPEIVRTLLLAGANLEVESICYRESAPKLAVKKNHIDVIMMLAQQIKLNEAFTLIGVDSKAFAQYLQRGLLPDSKTLRDILCLWLLAEK